ncbi:class II aldolase/adducin family protein [Labedaea rhizosphaerae]|uniref:L-fuculose-phosphate aldolase n=1 Tax=Labedaea rhizosphaerae TaxID=598644 RepID=A0A4R6SC24_LABRH|nr:class II aldolase/adducin family protein [Labedaea rhizosphaerae]TDP97609.1 L-fuculose-phosphate aldolase [Labedaea rhizosphaerae]
MIPLAAQRVALADAARRIAARGLVIGTAGNLSVRAGDLIAVSPTGCVLGELTADDVPVIDLTGAVVAGSLAPTSETALHTRIYRETGALAVAHAHAPASIAVACTHEELPVLHYAQSLGLGGAVRVAPFASFGTEELAAAVVEALAGRGAALLANHGSVAVGASIEQACERLELLEWCADLYARAVALGTPRPLTEAQQAEVAAVAAARNYGTTQAL